MQFEKLILENCRQHEDLTINFKPGVNLLLGPNGAGKSTVVGALRYAVEGTLPWVKERCIRDGATSGAVTLEFNDSGRHGRVTRALHTSSASISYNGGKAIRKSAEVDRLLGQILGASSKVLGTYCFVQQDETTRVLGEQPSKRLALFNVLFGTDRCEIARQLLAGELQTVVPVTLSADAASLPDRISAMETELSSMRSKASRAADLAKAANMQSMHQQLAEATARIDRYNHPVTGYGVLADRLDNAKSLSSGGDSLITAAQSAVDAATTERDSSAVLMAQAKARLQRSAEAEKARAARDSLQRQVQQLEREAADNPSSVVEPDRDASMQLFEADIQAREMKLAALQRDITDYEKFIHAFGAGKCSTCGTHAIVSDKNEIYLLSSATSEYQQKLQTAQADVANIRPAVLADRTELRQYQEKRQRSQTAFDRWQVWLQGFNARVEQLAISLAATPEVERVDAAGAEADIVKHRQAEERVKETSRQLEHTRHSVHSAAMEVTVLKGKVDELAALQPLPDVAELKRSLAEAERHTVEFNQLTGQAAATEKQLTYLKTNLQQIRAVDSRSKAIEKYRNLLSQAHGLLHRDCYPASVARGYFGRINEGWNKMLEHLDQPYTVRIDPDTSVRVQFPAAERMFEELSGGQKCCASLGFLLEVNRQFASQAGFLVLDEPTNGIDESHMENVRELLESVQRYSESTGLQVIVVTHAKALRGSAAHVIEL